MNTTTTPLFLATPQPASRMRTRTRAVERAGEVGNKLRPILEQEDHYEEVGRDRTRDRRGESLDARGGFRRSEQNPHPTFIAPRDRQARPDRSRRQVARSSLRVFKRLAQNRVSTCSSEKKGWDI
jgi:hypothetical protein